MGLPLLQTGGQSGSCAEAEGGGDALPAARFIGVVVKMERGTSLETLAGKGLILR